MGSFQLFESSRVSDDSAGQTLFESWVQPKHTTQEDTINVQKEFRNSTPFPSLVIPSFLREDKSAELLSALKRGAYAPENAQNKRMHIHVGSNPGAYSSCLTFFYTREFLTFIRSVTAMNLREIESAIGCRYSRGDFYSCHHDDNGTRKLTVLLFLSGLEETDGGALTLFQNEGDAATNVMQRIVPRSNTLVLLKAGSEHFYEIEEIQKDTDLFAFVLGFR